MNKTKISDLLLEILKEVCADGTGVSKQYAIQINALIRQRHPDRIPEAKVIFNPARFDKTTVETTDVKSNVFQYPSPQVAATTTPAPVKKKHVVEEPKALVDESKIAPATMEIQDRDDETIDLSIDSTDDEIMNAFGSVKKMIAYMIDAIGTTTNVPKNMSKKKALQFFRDNMF